MDEAIKKHVTNSIKDTYLKEFKNKYNWFLRVMCRNLIKHLLNCYGEIMTTDLEAKNNQMNNTVDSSLLIAKYF